MKSRWVPGPVNLNWGLGPVNLSWGLGAGNLNWGLTEIKFVTASPVVDLRSHPMPIKAISWRFRWNNDSEVLRYLGCVQHALWDALHGTDGAAADDARWQVMAQALVMLLLMLLLMERQALALQLVISGCGRYGTSIWRRYHTPKSSEIKFVTAVLKSWLWMILS